jgi:oligopeptide transport system ATP-binding protein
VLIADEPTTALDVTVQAQILDLLKSIQKDNQMAILLITHDLGVVANAADRVVVMYAGRVFEKGRVDDIFYRSEHPYTQALLKSTPRIDREDKVLPAIAGNTPDLTQVGTGCPFFERCGYRLDICKESFPESRKEKQSEHERFCHVEKLAK